MLAARHASPLSGTGNDDGNDGAACTAGKADWPMFDSPVKPNIERAVLYVTAFQMRTMAAVSGHDTRAARRRDAIHGPHDGRRAGTPHPHRAARGIWDTGTRTADTHNP